MGFLDCQRGPWHKMLKKHCCRGLINISDVRNYFFPHVIRAVHIVTLAN